MATKKKGYTEPDGFFPKEIRKKHGLGEFNKTKPTKAKATSKKK